MESSNDVRGKGVDRSIKKCPECHAYMPLEAKKCPECHKRVGSAGRDGIAKKAIDWSSYFTCLLVWVLLGVYLWWAFFRK